MFRLFLSVILAAACAAPLFAYELSLTGHYTNRFTYLSRVGHGDLFGNVLAAQQPGSPGITSLGLSGPYWGQVVPERYSVNGSDGSYQEESYEFRPVLRINPAVRINSVISFQGSLNGPYTGGPNWITPSQRFGTYNAAGRSESAWDAAAIPVLRHAWLNATTPWGVINFGRRPWVFGLGWSGFHAADSADTSLSLTVPYGPLSFVVGAVLHDSGEATDPFDSRNADRTPLTVASGVDRNEMRALNFKAGLVYRDGPLEIGTLNRTVAYNRVHSFPRPRGWTIRDDMTGSFAARFFAAARQPVSDSADEPAMPIYGDVALVNQITYIKYADGRWFANGEWAQQWLTANRDGGRPISGRPWAAMIETGAISGPSKVTLAYFHRTGHDRSGGILDVATADGGRNGWRQSADSWSQYIVTGGAASAIDPYVWLVGLYGAGNNSYDAAGGPTYLDFRAVAFRGDYAVAANLNLWLSFAACYRASSTGAWWGQYTGGLATPPVRGSNVPDNGLGTEAGCGLDWKLLENLTFSVRGAYWQPGQWFQHAYVDWSTTQTVQDFASDAVVRINPGRSIGQILGLRAGVTAEF